MGPKRNQTGINTRSRIGSIDENIEIPDELKNMHAAFQEISIAEKSSVTDEQDFLLTINGKRLYWEEETTRAITNLTTLASKNSEKIQKLIDEKQDEKIYDELKNIKKDCEKQETAFNKFRQEFLEEYFADQKKTSDDLIDVVKKTIEEKMSKEIRSIQNQINILTTENSELTQYIREHIREINEKLNEDFDKIEDNQKNIQEISEKVNSVENKITIFSQQNTNRARSSTPGILNSTIINQPKITFKRPRFTGDSKERPIKFLNDLKKYVNVHNMDNQEILCSISDCLDGSASKWWGLIEESVENFEEFSIRFRDRYWNSSVQRSIRRKIEFDHYDQQNKKTRAEYAMEIFGLAKDLDKPYEDKEVIQCLAMHFGRDIRNMIRAANVDSKEKLLELLDEYENENEQYKKIRDRRDFTKNIQFSDKTSETNKNFENTNKNNPNKEDFRNNGKDNSKKEFEKGQRKPIFDQRRNDGNQYRNMQLQTTVESSNDEKTSKNE